MIPEITSATASASTSKLDENSKLKLQKAVKEFESIFVNYLLQNMRKSIQKSEEESTDFGGEMMQGMFDLEIAKSVSKKGSLGIGAMLYKQITGEELPASMAIGLPRFGTAMDQLRAVGIANQGKIAEVADLTKSASVPDAVNVVSVADRTKVAAVKADTAAMNMHQRLGQFDDLIKDASGEFDLNPNLIKAVIAAESAGNPRAISSKRAKGLMQLIDSTATAMGVQDVWNPGENIYGGSKYLKQLLERFDGDQSLALASYNAGPGAVQKHGGIPPYAETQQYVKRVMSYFRIFEQQGVSGDEER